MKQTPRSRDPSLLEAVIPILVLVLGLGSSVACFGDGSSGGPNQTALLLAAAVATALALRRGYAWRELEEGINDAVAVSVPAMVILMLVGALIGIWILLGTVPLLIELSAMLLAPSLFYAGACVIAAIVALAIGSSWTTAGTIGVALIGAAQLLGLDPAITAGAIISGAYFGDKLSPLSDTTNLASAAAGTDLFAHISYMVQTSVPALTLSLIVFLMLGGGSAEASLPLDSVSHLLPPDLFSRCLLMLPLLLLFGLSVARVPAIMTIFIGICAALVLVVVVDRPGSAFLAADLRDDPLTPWRALFEGVRYETGSDAIDALLSRGGSASMLGTIWLILCAMVFGGIMEKSGALRALLESVQHFAQTLRGLLVSTIAAALATNILTADQYISVVIPGRLFRDAYRSRGVPSQRLSRALEDGGTLTSVLIPWNTCGAYMAGTLGVATLSYLPYALFNLFSLALALVLASLARQAFEPERSPTPS